MVKLLDFYREHGYPMNGAAYQRITNRIASGEYPVYAPSKKIRYITHEVAEQILKEVPPPTSDVEVEEDMETGEGAAQVASSPEEDAGLVDELRSLREEVVELRKAVSGLTKAMQK
jgi:hypothetical protein